MNTPTIPTGVEHDCPDCLSETVVQKIHDDVDLYVVTIFHNLTCPALNQKENTHE